MRESKAIWIPPHRVPDTDEGNLTLYYALKQLRDSFRTKAMQTPVMQSTLDRHISQYQAIVKTLEDRGHLVHRDMGYIIEKAMTGKIPIVVSKSRYCSFCGELLDDESVVTSQCSKCNTEIDAKWELAVHKPIGQWKTKEEKIQGMMDINGFSLAVATRIYERMEKMEVKG